MNTFRNDRTSWPIVNREQWLARREGNINASDIAALFHAHKFTSAFQLWAFQTGKLKRDDVDTLAMRRGRIFEPAVAAALREQHPEWDVTAADRYDCLSELKLGATPDFFAWPTKDPGDTDCFLIQVKTAIPEVFDDEWTPAPPVSYLLQVQCEMFVTGIDRCVLAVMVLDGREFPVHEYEFKADPEIHAQIEVAAQRFWRCVEKGEEPKLHHPQDAWAIARLHPDADTEAVLALHGSADVIQTCEAYKAVASRIKDLEDEKEALASKLKGTLRNHAKAEAQNWRINWTTVAEQHVAAHVKKAHRRLTVTKIRP